MKRICAVVAVLALGCGEAPPPFSRISMEVQGPLTSESGLVMVANPETSLIVFGSKPGTMAVAVVPAGTTRFAVDTCSATPCPMSFGPLSMTTGSFPLGGDLVEDVRLEIAPAVTGTLDTDVTFLLSGADVKLTAEATVDGERRSATYVSDADLSGVLNRGQSIASFMWVLDSAKD